MSSTQGRHDDRSTRARIRDEAIRVFATQGFGATVRGIAEAAGVSPGLVIHHFGSKAALREECDGAVLRAIADDKQVIVGHGADFEAYLVALQEDPRARTQIVYLLRAVAEGGETARTVMERSIALAREGLRAGVEDGRYRPSVDEDARARYLGYVSIGTLLVDTMLHPPADWSDPVEILRGYIDRTALPALEYAAHGLGVGPAAVESFMKQRGTRPRDPTRGESA
ncbi:MAG: TetR family transcriptional regulator [Gordonia sp. (in: high G+C Gram-positive bacteria)]|uniref:TetR/AcrR family transcriptional regulator n=1 Tax=Gordonia sp. (in: high G+C Gram-positive bacteria) TaxID=84139 RepID=UPI0039E3ED28